MILYLFLLDEGEHSLKISKPTNSYISDFLV